MKFTKILALMLAAVMCVCVFAACKKNDNTDKNGDNDSDSFVSITILDNEGKEIYKNEKLDVDLTIDGTDGKLFVTNILDLCCYFDESLDYDYDEAEELLTINGLESIEGYKTEQVLDEDAMKEAKEEAKKNNPDAEESELKIDPIYMDVNFYYFWTMTINEEEVGIGDEIKLGDEVVLSFTKLSEEELLRP